MNTTDTKMINGIDVDQLKGTIENVAHSKNLGMTRWQVSTHWTGGAKSETKIKGCYIGGEYIEKDFKIHIDEPTQLCGTNTNPNPQETLMAALNACMMMGYTAGCALEGIELEEIRIETRGDIDLRGFLGIRQDVPAGYEEMEYTVYIKGDGTPEQFKKVHDFVSKTSPNRYTIANPIKLKSEMVVE